VILSILEMILFMNTGDFNSLFTFIFIAILVSFFNKNMIVILCVSLAAANILKYGIKGVVNEGFEDDSAAEGEKPALVEAASDVPATKPTAGPTTSPAPTTKPPAVTEAMKKDYSEFTDVQEKINEGMKQMEPLLNKAETFIDKYKHLL
jgi:hypothetical protein